MEQSRRVYEAATKQLGSFLDLVSQQMNQPAAERFNVSSNFSSFNIQVIYWNPFLNQSSFFSISLQVGRTQLCCAEAESGNVYFSPWCRFSSTRFDWLISYPEKYWLQFLNLWLFHLHWRFEFTSSFFCTDASIDWFLHFALCRHEATPWRRCPPQQQVAADLIGDEQPM